MTRSTSVDADVRAVVDLVLWVARLGEVDHYSWWGTQSYGPAGRVVLRQRLPRTWRMAAIELDMLAASTRCNEVLDRPNAVHLFSDNWPARRWAGAWVSEQKTASEPDHLFDRLETLSTADVVRAVQPGGVDASVGETQAHRVGTIDPHELTAPGAVRLHAHLLASASLAAEGRFFVPYLEVAD